MNMHDPVVIAKKASKLVWLAAAMALGLFACQVEDSIERDNPSDAAGTNYHLPTVSVITHADTTFRDSSSLRIRVRDSSTNSRIVRLRWTLDGSVSDSTTDTTWHPRSGLSEGQHLIVVRAVDSAGLVSLPDTVRVKVYNKPPVLAHVLDTTLSANKLLSIKLSATDSDGTVSKILWGMTKGAWTDSTGTVTLSPMAEGAKKIYWSARDDLGKVSVDSFTATFTNLAPVLAHVLDTTLSANKLLSIKLSATDSDGTVSKILWGTTKGVWTDSTGMVTLSPMAEGAKKIYWSVRDDLGKVSVDSFTATFTNLAPVLAHVRDTTLLVSQVLAVTLSAHDSDGVVKEYLFDTTGNGWDSSATAPMLRITSANESSRKIHWGVRDDLGKTTMDSFAVTFMIDRPLLTAISDTTVSASKALVIPLNARPLDGSSSAVTKYLWSTNGSTWDSSSTASISLSDTAGGALTVQWKARNSLGNVSKPDTFVVTFLHAPMITSLSVDSNLTSWSSGTGSLIFTWAGSLPNVPAGETITWTLSGGTSGLSQLYSGTSTTYTQSGIDSGVTYNYRLVGRNQFGDSAVSTGALATKYHVVPVTSGGIPWNKSIEYGTLTDSRDGQTYYTVKIGNQTWMAQNLNFRNMVGSTDTVGVCYGGNKDSCSKYGRLYTWAEAMGLMAGFNSVLGNFSLPRRGVCPSGWHLPSSFEWTSLFEAVGGDSSVGRVLKSKTGWGQDTLILGKMEYNANGEFIDSAMVYDTTIITQNGLDQLGFRALAAGYANGGTTSSYSVGHFGDWWSASELGSASAWHVIMASSTNGVCDDSNCSSSMRTSISATGLGGVNSKMVEFSLRCVAN